MNVEERSICFMTFHCIPAFVSTTRSDIFIVDYSHMFLWSEDFVVIVNVIAMVET